MEMEMEVMVVETRPWSCEPCDSCYSEIQTPFLLMRSEKGRGSDEESEGLVSALVGYPQKERKNSTAVVIVSCERHTTYR